MIRTHECLIALWAALAATVIVTPGTTLACAGLLWSDRITERAGAGA